MSRAALALAVLLALAATGAGVGGAEQEALADTPAAASAGSVVPWHGAGQAPCPEGMTRRTSAATESFDTALPHASFADGFSRVSGSAMGGSAARSVLPADGSNTRDHLFLRWAQVPVGATTMLGFATRGTTAGGYYATVDVNSVSHQVTVGSTTWSGRVLDVTPATRDEAGRLGTWVEHRAQPGRRTYWDLDNVQLYTCRSAPVSRIAGADRYATSAAVSATFAAGVPVAYLAVGTEYADALGGAALAGAQRAPVLLVKPDAIPGAVLSELRRLRPQRIVVLGGPLAVSEAVLEQARALATSGTADRLGGATRFETSARISAEFAPARPVVYVATGRAYPDALAGGALAGHQAVPVLLTEQGSLPAPVRAELQRLQPRRIVVLGGPQSVSDGVLSALRGLTTGSVTRIAGADRYQTAALVAGQFPTGGDRVYLANGTNYPDALSGAALAARRGVPVLLARPTDLPGAARTRLDALGARSGILLGGSGSLAAIVMDQLGGHVG